MTLQLHPAIAKPVMGPIVPAGQAVQGWETAIPVEYEPVWQRVQALEALSAE